MSNQPTKESLTNMTTESTTTETPIVDALSEHLTEQAFEDWHQLNIQEQNKEEGYDETRNDPTYIPDDTMHSPSKLLGCHRNIEYAARNAPEEESLPHGIFKFGHDFEDYIEAFLSDVIVDDDHEVRNVIETDVNVDGLTISGTTDPVVFDDDGTPVALFEVKTTKDTYHVRNDGVDTQHLAQAHAYAMGIKQKFGLDEHLPIFFVYGGREDLDVFISQEEFDVKFWESEVLEWAKENTEYRQRDELAPPLPDDSDKKYMCGYCSFKERCGAYEPESASPNADEYVESVDPYWWNDDIKTSVQNTHEDMGVEGFLPMTKYPEATVVAHLASYPDVKLTPTLAVTYPGLVDNGETPPERLSNIYGVAPQREVQDWICTKCLNTFEFGQFNWDGHFENVPTCPDCPDNAELRGMRHNEITF